MMAAHFQVTFDADNPHAQAAWWAATLGWQVEPQDEQFIRRMVDQGAATEDETMVWEGRLVWRTGAAITPPADSGMPRVLFQWVPEPKAGKNRVHLDLRIAADDLPEFRASLVRRGATVLWEASQGPYSWVTMADPEGNEFCV